MYDLPVQYCVINFQMIDEPAPNNVELDWKQRLCLTPTTKDMGSVFSVFLKVDESG